MVYCYYVWFWFVTFAKTRMKVRGVHCWETGHLKFKEEIKWCKLEKSTTLSDRNSFIGNKKKEKKKKYDIYIFFEYVITIKKKSNLSALRVHFDSTTK